MKLFFTRKKGESIEDEQDEFMVQFRASVARLAIMVGVTKLDLGLVKSEGLSRSTIENVEFSELATQGIRDYADLVLPMIGDVLASIGITSVKVEYEEDEERRFGDLWKKTTESAIDHSAEKIAAAEDKQREVEAKKQSDDNTVKASAAETVVKPATKGPVLVANNINASIDAIYTSVAELLPIEGRDYALSPEEYDPGKVHLRPVAYTRIGKIWLEYLREVLPIYAPASQEMKNDILHAKPV